MTDQNEKSMTIARDMERARELERELRGTVTGTGATRIIAAALRAERAPLEKRIAELERIADDVSATLVQAAELAMARITELEAERDQIRAERDELRLKLSGAERVPAPRPEPRPVRVGDTVRITRCCYDRVNSCCMRHVGRVGTVRMIDDAADSVLPYSLRVLGRCGWFAAVERVDPEEP